MEWTAFETVYGPITVHERIDAAAAQICWIIASAFSDGKRELSPADFMAQWSAEDAPRERKRQSPEEMIAILRSLQKPKDEPARGNDS